MKKITLSIFIFLFSTFIYFPIYAQSDGNSKESGAGEKGIMRDEKMQAKDERKDEMMEAKDDRLEQKKSESQAQKCERVRNRISERYTNYGELKKQQSTKYFNFINKLNGIVEKLSVYDLDVSVLEADIVEMERLINVYIESYDAFLASLNNMGNTCDSDETGNTYRGMLTESKELLATARENRKAIVDYYAHNVRATIADLRAQAVQLKKDSVTDTEDPTSVEVIESEENNE